jgi:hypothetical protein
VCVNGAQNNQCSMNGTNFLPNITATLTLYNTVATVAVDRLSFSIISVLDVGNPVADPAIDIAGYRQALDWLLDFHSAGIPATSSIAEIFWDGQSEFNSNYSASSVYTTFQSILAFPIWLFNANNFGNTELAPNQIDPNLPKQFYTTASISTPYTKIAIGQWIFWAFVALEIAVHSFIWIALLWICFTEPHPPQLSSYPLIDFVIKAKHRFQTRELLPDENSKGALWADDRTTLAYLCHTESITCATGIALYDSVSNTALVATPGNPAAQASGQASSRPEEAFDAPGARSAAEATSAIEGTCAKQVSSRAEASSKAARVYSDATGQNALPPACKKHA